MVFILRLLCRAQKRIAHMFGVLELLRPPPPIKTYIHRFVLEVIRVRMHREPHVQIQYPMVTEYKLLLHVKLSQVSSAVSSKLGMGSINVS